MHNIQPDLPPSLTRDHPIASFFGWLAATVSILLTVLLVWMVVAVVDEWSGYAGGESGAAIAILGFVALVTAVTWSITSMIFAWRRRS